jgi:uncharacterized protein (DUF58 family)
MNADAYRQALIDGERAGDAWTLVPPRTMQMRSGGIRDGRRGGGSLEFREYREYQPGDDLRHLDWNVFARSDKLTVKQFHEEVSPFVEVILDMSRSMALEDSRKPHVALGLAAMMTTAARNSGFPSSVLYARDRLSRPAASAARAAEWPVEPFDFRGNPAEALIRASQMLKPFSTRVLISDLLWPVDAFPVVQALANGAAALVIIEVMAAADARPDFSGDLRLIDTETDEPLDIAFDRAAADEYRDALRRHRELWDTAARNSAALMLRCVAEDVGDDLVFGDLAGAEILRPAWLPS